MKVLITVDMDVSQALALQTERTGFSVVRDGAGNMRLKIGRELVSVNKATVTIKREGTKVHGNKATAEEQKASA